MKHWSTNSFFYHIYPLGMTGAPERNDFSTPPTPRLKVVEEWIDHLKWLGVNAVYIGPLFESTAHGYDTVDYYHLDRRLGTDETLMALSEKLHGNGIRLVLDCVFNHVGRDFWAFKDVREKGWDSLHKDWFQGLRFEGSSPAGDPFTYEGWAGHYDLVKLNLSHPGVREHLFGAVRSWIERFDIDGLRLDAADVMDGDFLRDLATFTKSIKPDFWMVGEIVHGDYMRLMQPGMLDSVTNYECYKGLHSSLNDANYYEIAYGLNRQFGENGLYRGLLLYNFVDNHDVNRVASEIKKTEHLYSLYLMLFTMPGVPSIYYGSEWGIEGERTKYSDRELRPMLNIHTVNQFALHPALPEAIRKLAQARATTPALRYGGYEEIYLSHETFAFKRSCEEGDALIVLNAIDEPVELKIPLPGESGPRWRDILDREGIFQIRDGCLHVDSIPANWGRILVNEE